MSIMHGVLSDLEGANLSKMGIAQRSYLRSGRHMVLSELKPQHPGYNHQKITEDAETTLRRARVNFLWFYLVNILAVFITVGVALW